MNDYLKNEKTQYEALNEQYKLLECEHVKLKAYVSRIERYIREIEKCRKSLLTMPVIAPDEELPF